MTILVGFRGGVDDRSGIELAGSLGRSAGLDLDVVTVVPASWPTPVSGGVDRDFDRWSTEQGEAAVAEAQALLADRCSGLRSSVRWVAARSVASGLTGEAERTGASMLAVGSGSGAGYGHVHLGSIAARLLHSSPVPVAVATRGYHAEDGATVRRATCAFRGDEESLRTVERTAAICAEVGAQLRVATFAVRGRTMYPPTVTIHAEDLVLKAWVEQAKAAQTAALAELRGRGSLPQGAETVIGTGRSWTAALDSVGWERDDVLVVGSARERALERLFLGSSATKIVRYSPVPVIVVP